MDGSAPFVSFELPRGFGIWVLFLQLGFFKQLLLLSGLVTFEEFQNFSLLACQGFFCVCIDVELELLCVGGVLGSRFGREKTRRRSSVEQG